ncbi:MAG: SAM-dependent methyltransferase [Clostridiales bacterium]|nr:MAG: SAM-dependent methyltransferase [Clostridiales bacterium]
MNGKQKPKILMLLNGFSSKYGENPDYFDIININAVSGAKTYTGTVTVNEKTIEYAFGASKTFKSFDEMINELVQALLGYDSVSVEYIERGTGTRIVADDRNVKLEKFEIKDNAKAFGLKSKKYNLDLGKAAQLLKTIGFMTDDGKLKNDMIRKYNQTDRFLDLTGDLFDGKKNLTVVDCACGKSYLSFVLNHYLWEEKHIRARFVGIDIKQNVIDESRRIADTLGYKNMEFICEDLRTFDGIKPDAVISLHACDVATDMALGFAIRNGAKSIICVPCCHKELLDKYQKPDLEPIIKHGIFRARLNDILTDGLRTLKLEACGYKVSCVEYCSPLDTPKNLLIRAQKVCERDKKAEDEYYNLLSQLKVMPSIEIYSAIQE